MLEPLLALELLAREPFAFDLLAALDLDLVDRERFDDPVDFGAERFLV